MDSKRDNIYIYLWDEFNTIYIGRTINPKSRHYAHKHRESERTYQFSSEHHVEHPKMIIIENDLSIEEGIEREKYWIEYYRNETQYNVINKLKGGQIGKVSKLSDEERVKHKKNSNKIYRKSHKEEMKLYKKKYREEHKEEIKKYKKQYYQEHNEEIKIKFKEYRDTHKEQNKILQKSYREVHKEEMRLYKKKYREEHKEKIRATLKEYHEAHKEEHNIKARKYYETNRKEILTKQKEKRKRKNEEGNKTKDS